MTDLVELAAQCEAAGKKDQFHLLGQAFVAIFGKPKLEAIDRWPGWQWPQAYEVFEKFLSAGAYLDAALMLAPERSLHLADILDQAMQRAVRGLNDDELFRERFALFVCAAALRSQANRQAARQVNP